ncbi:MAG TPA: hypothetical protein PLG30_13515, partial [Bacteroidia bacterium]|nr:hypothetical protein [Bacteroidia bacterium]
PKNLFSIIINQHLKEYQYRFLYIIMGLSIITNGKLCSRWRKLQCTNVGLGHRQWLGSSNSDK